MALSGIIAVQTTVWNQNKDKSETELVQRKLDCI